MDGDLVLAGVAGAAGVGPGLLGLAQHEGEEAEGGGASPALHRLDVSLLRPAQVQQLKYQEQAEWGESLIKIRSDTAQWRIKTSGRINLTKSQLIHHIFLDESHSN